MSRKKQAPKRIFYPDPKYGSLILAKFINFVMYDGKKTTSEKIIYDALKKIKEKTKEDPIKIFNEIYDAYQNKGSAIKKKEDTHKMAESNKAFAHFRW